MRNGIGCRRRMGAVAVAAVRVAGRAPDARHAFGHAKAEYFASLIDAILIGVTTVLILTSAIDRLHHPQPVEGRAVAAYL